MVLDAWPIVEYYGGNDPSAETVEELLSDISTAAVISSVNFAEVYSAVATKVQDFAVASHFVRKLKEVVHVVEPSPEISELAALIKHCYHMSLGDCFAAATAIAFSSGLWFSKTRWYSDDQPTSFVELWTGDCELICENRVWRVRDLRTSNQQMQHATAIADGKKKAGLRAGTAMGWSILNHPSGPVLIAQGSVEAELLGELH